MNEYARPKGDLISRKYMKEAIEQFFEMVKYYHPHSKGRKTIPTEEVLDIIDNAPTVETPCEQASEIIKAYKKGFDDGYEKGRQDLIDYIYGKMKGGAE